MIAIYIDRIKEDWRCTAIRVDGDTVVASWESVEHPERRKEDTYFNANVRRVNSESVAGSAKPARTTSVIFLPSGGPRVELGNRFAVEDCDCTGCQGVRKDACCL